MARVDNLSNFLTDVANSIRDKKEITGTITPANFDTEIAGIETGITPSGTIDILANGTHDVTYYASANVNIEPPAIANGSINQFLAESETISANSFVEFVNKNFSLGVDVQLDTSGGRGYVISAVALDDERIFLAHTSDKSSKYLYGSICTVSESSITLDATTEINGTVSSSGAYVKATLLDNDKVFLTYSGESSGRHLYGVVCTISGTTISVGAYTPIAEYTDASVYQDPVALDNEKVFIAYGYYVSAGNYRLYGVVCTVSGTTISVGTHTALNTTDRTGVAISAVLLDKNKVFIAHCYRYNTTSEYYLYGTTCVISGTTITVGSSVAISDVLTSSATNSVAVLNSEKVFIVYDYGSSRHLYGVVCNVTETTITAGTHVAIDTTQYSGLVPLVVSLDSNRVFVPYHYYSGSIYYLGAKICTISGTDITIVQSETTDVRVYLKAVAKLNNNKIIVAHAWTSGASYLCATLYNIPQTVKLATNNIQGLTKTDCTPTVAGDVWILDK